MEIFYNWRNEKVSVQVTIPNKISRRIKMLRKQLDERKKGK